MNNQNGNIAEGKFISEAISRGFSISKPVVGESQYDYILDNKKELIRVQVKSTHKHRKENDRYKINTNYGGGDKKLYTNGDIDIFAIYVADCDVWYFISIDDIQAKTINLYPHRESNGSYESYKDNWKVLR